MERSMGVGNGNLLLPIRLIKAVTTIIKKKEKEFINGLRKNYATKGSSEKIREKALDIYNRQ